MLNWRGWSMLRTLIRWLTLESLLLRNPCSTVHQGGRTGHTLRAAPYALLPLCVADHTGCLPQVSGTKQVPCWRHVLAPAYQVARNFDFPPGTFHCGWIFKKLAPRFIGLFEIQSIINPVTVQLSLSRNMKVHNVLHVSQVKLVRTSFTWEVPLPVLYSTFGSAHYLWPDRRGPTPMIQQFNPAVVYHVSQLKKIHIYATVGIAADSSAF